jgi:hypothetical protein
MPFLILLLLIALVVPGLGLALLLFLFLGVLLILPLQFFVHSLITIVTVPWQLIQIASDRRIRQNHACEHATVNVMEERYGPLPRTGGLAFKNGYTILGAVPSPAELLDAAQEGLYRLKGGELALALHPRCGTSIAVSQFLFAGGFLFILFWIERLQFLEILVVILLAGALSRPLGLVAQRYITTTPDVADLQIADVSFERPDIGLGLSFLPLPRAYFVRTEIVRAPPFWIFRRW